MVHLTIKDFNEADGRPQNPQLRNGPFFAMLSSTRCGFCTKVKPKFEAMRVPNIPNFVIDSDAPDPNERKLFTAVNEWMDKSVNGVPTFVLFQPNGEILQYKGPHSEEGWRAWLAAPSS